jgi:hypothetical protein
MCGFPLGKLPNASQFYRFLSSTKNSELQNILYSLNQKLIAEKFISTDILIMDSKPVLAATKDNNMKNPNRNTRNKLRKPKRNPAASLGYYSYQAVNGAKDNFIFFWGYRTHVLISKEGIPLVEKTLPNHYPDEKVAFKLIRKLIKIYGGKKGALFLADAAYDVKELYDFIMQHLKSQAFIPLNPRNTQPPKTLGPQGKPLCPAGLEMLSQGISREPKRTRIKFRCPLKTSAKQAQKYPAGCPINHPRFLSEKQYGCTAYLDVTNDARAQVPRNSAYFKSTFKLRTEVERYFARLGDREAEQTTHYKLRSIQNQLTLMHLSMSLIAAAALLLNQPENLRCYRTFHLHQPSADAA